MEYSINGMQCFLIPGSRPKSLDWAKFGQHYFLVFTDFKKVESNLRIYAMLDLSTIHYIISIESLIRNLKTLNTLRHLLEKMELRVGMLFTSYANSKT